MACGHRRAAVRSGRAECTPNLRASYDAADTTPRSFGRPPTTTGLPLSEGSNNSSTDTKNASMSTWKMVFTALLSFCTRIQRSAIVLVEAQHAGQAVSLPRQTSREAVLPMGMAAYRAAARLSVATVAVGQRQRG